MAVGGVTVPATEVQKAVAILQDAPGVMIRQPLSRAGNLLAAMDYHAVAASERQRFPQELVLEPGTHTTPTPHEKTALIHYLQRILPS